MSDRKHSENIERLPRYSLSGGISAFLDTKFQPRKMPIMKVSEVVKKKLLLAITVVLSGWVWLFTQNSESGEILPLPDSLKTEISADSILAADIVSDSIYSTQVDSVFYAADTVHYSETKQQIILSGNSNIKYHDATIQSDVITIDMAKEQAYAHGKSIMKDSSQLIISEDVYYDLDSQWGLLFTGASKFDKGYYYGEEIRKIDKKTFDADQGFFTTCDAMHPHFYIGSRKLRIYQNDKVVGKPVIFYVNHFPVMAVPFGTFTIKRGRQTGILVPTPGWNDVNGKFLENIAYYYAYKDYADATLALDYYEKTGWQLGFTSQYIKRYIFNGNFAAIFQKRISGPQKSTNEWNIRSRHHHEFGNNTTFDADLNFVSSSIVWEGSDDPNERLAEKITSAMAYRKPFLSSILNIRATYVHDLLGDDKQFVVNGDTLNLQVERKDITLPSISYSLPSKPFYELFLTERDDIPEDAWWKDFSYSYSFKAAQSGFTQDPQASLEEIIWDNYLADDGTYINRHNAGVKHSASIRYSNNLKGWLNISQSINASEAWFDRDQNDRKWVRGSDYNTNSSLLFNLYGLKRTAIPYITAIRHIITPSLNFSYQPDFKDNKKFYSFEGIGLRSSGKQRRTGFSLNNKWQLKLRATKSLKERKINDFFNLRSDISYDFEKEGNGFSNISHSLNIRPNQIKWKFFEFGTTPSGSITQETYGLKFKDWKLKQWDLAVSDWSVSLSSKFAVSGDAHYVEYFPLPENRFESSGFMMADSLSVEAERDITTIKELAELNREKKNWSFSFTHNYKTNKNQYEKNDYSSDLRMMASLKLTRNWLISYDNYINLKTDKVVSHNFTITRELHCWRMFFRYTQQGDYWSYRLQLFNLQLPDALRFRTSDHKR